MQSYNAIYSRKMNKGRPFKFKSTNECLEERKKELFEEHNSNKIPMNLINLAFHFGKLTKEEFDTACFLEHLFNKIHKNLGMKTISSSSPHTWVLNLKSSWQNISMYEDTTANEVWKKIKSYVQMKDPRIAGEFFNIICKHYSYEDLCAIKTSTFMITNILKDGLKIVYEMIEKSYI